MKVEFYPEKNSKEVLDGLAEYEGIWQRDGDKIIKNMEEISGIQFEDEVIKIFVFYDPKRKSNSHNYVINIRANYSNDFKKGCLIHELAHQLVIDEMIEGKNIEIHFFLGLILFDIWSQLYGEDFAEQCVKIESGFGSHRKEAWDWALSFNKEEREKKFKELVEV